MELSKIGDCEDGMDACCWEKERRMEINDLAEENLLQLGRWFYRRDRQRVEMEKVGLERQEKKERELRRQKIDLGAESCCKNFDSSFYS